MKATAPLISVCIPVFATEPYLAQCLRSVFMQDFPAFEVVVVSDASCGTDARGRRAKRIVCSMQRAGNKRRRQQKLPAVSVRYVEHKENRGLIEVRRTLMAESRGAYITQLDSDDELEAGALSALYAAAQEHNADITHGTSTAGTFDENGVFVPAKSNRSGTIYYGTLAGRQIFRSWLMERRFTANTWGKLIKRELFVRAYEHIPYTECNMADDVLLFFFLSQYAERYVGIKAPVYRYRVNTGMTSTRTINTLQRWKLICSAASVFSVISTWLAEKQNAASFCLQPDEIAHVREMTRFYLANNLKQLHETVVPELQAEARALLCEYWGESFVAKIEHSASVLH